MDIKAFVNELKTRLDPKYKVIYRKNFVTAYRDLYQVELDPAEFIILVKIKDEDKRTYSIRMILNSNIPPRKVEKLLRKTISKIQKAGKKI